MESYQKELALIRTILKNNPKGMTVTDIARELEINRNSVAKYLDVLLISGHVEMITFGPAKVFFPSRRIPVSAILNFTLDYIALFDRDLKFLQVNDNLLRFLHVPQEEILGQPVETYSHALFQIPQMIINVQQALDGKESISEIRFPINEKERYLRVKHIPTTFEDGGPGVTLIIEDITERKIAEERMKQVIQQWETTFNSIVDMISIQDDQYSILRVNQAFADFLHLKPEECIGKKCYELVHGMKRSHSSCPCIQITLTKKPTTVEFFEPHLGRHLEISASPLFNDNGDISGSVHIMKDITERKKNNDRR